MMQAAAGAGGGSQVFLLGSRDGSTSTDDSVTSIEYAGTSFTVLDRLVISNFSHLEDIRLDPDFGDAKLFGTGIVTLDYSDLSNLSSAMIDENNRYYSGLINTVRNRIYTLDDNAIDEFSYNASSTTLEGIGEYIFSSGRKIMFDRARQVLFGCSYTNDNFVSFDAASTLQGSNTLSEVIGISGAAEFVLDLSSNYAYVSGFEGFHVIDISNPSAMSELTNYNTDPQLSGNIQMAHDTDRSIIFAWTGNTNEFLSIDISDPLSVSVLGSYSSASYTDVEALTYDPELQTAFFCDEGSSTIVAIDCSDPSNPSEVASLTDATNIADIDSMIPLIEYSHLSTNVYT